MTASRRHRRGGISGGMLACGALGMLLSACSAPPWYDPEKPHHTRGGFVNPGAASEEHGLADLIRWRREAGRKAIPDAASYTFPVADTDTAYLRHNGTDPTATWIGHATVLLQLGGVNILTDPHFGERASPVSWAGPRRAVPPSPALSELPPIHAVVLSHDHYDSLDAGTVRRLRARPGGADTVFFTPLGYKAWFADLGVTNVVELDWWEQAEAFGVTFTAVPVQHWCKRGLFDRNKRLWAGWVIAGAGRKVMFVGDSGYTPGFADIGGRLGPFDLALIPIGAYAPRWFMKPHHMNPEEAVRAHADLRARRSIAIHWGTFVLTDEPLTEPPGRLAAAREAAGLPEDAFRVLIHGETTGL